MCDFSLQHAKSRPAAVADKLVTHNFGKGTIGLRDAADAPGAETTAVCIVPGTELAFAEPPRLRFAFSGAPDPKYTTAIFRQINKESLHVHHDALEMPDGEQVLLTTLEEGQAVTVLQLPAAPKTETEAQEQKRLEVVA